MPADPQTLSFASLSVAAVSIGFTHCLFGPDHYLPFVAMARVGSWSLKKTLAVTTLCGVGHVAGSAVLGFVGIGLGIIVFQLEAAEEQRGALAAWLLIGFGLIYGLWGLAHAVRRSKSARSPDALLARAERKTRASSMTPWMLFTIFLFGPCEPLIPLLMFPASQANMLQVVWTTLLFGLTTLITMAGMVAFLYKGAHLLPLVGLQTYGHALAGGIVLACGVAVKWGL